MLAMGERIIVSGGGLLRVFLLPQGTLAACVPLAGSGALCCGPGAVFCACGREGTVFRLDAETLTPRALFAGGPGICGMALRDGRLYTLCGEGDGVLMLDGGDGSPLVFARAGLSPVQMTAADDGALVIAGGEGSDITRLCPRTLRVLSRERMPWPVVGAAACGAWQYALCINDALAAELIAVGGNGERRMLRFSGMPGALAADACGARLLAAAEGGVYIVNPDGLFSTGFLPLPGYAGGMGSRLQPCASCLLLLDAARGLLWALTPGGRKLLCADAADAALLDT